MIFDPFEREDQANTNPSKTKAFVNTLVPLSIKQLNSLIANKQDFSALGKIVLIGRVVKLREMVGRTQVKLSDESGNVALIEGQGGC